MENSDGFSKYHIIRLRATLLRYSERRRISRNLPCIIQLHFHPPSSKGTGQTHLRTVLEKLNELFTRIGSPYQSGLLRKTSKGRD